MTTKEKIKDLEDRISSKYKEISELKAQLCKEKVTDFYERNNLKPKQHFLYKGNECVGAICDDEHYIKTFRIKKNGEPSRVPIIIYYGEDIKHI